MKTDMDRTKEHMRSEIQRWATEIGAKPKRVQIQRMTTKWASCSTSGRICFSTELLEEPGAFREVVIVHELLHLLVPNHGKLFKSLMNAYVPDWQARVGGRTSLMCGQQRATRTMTPAEAVADIRELRKGVTLGGLRIKDLINEGRK